MVTHQGCPQTPGGRIRALGCASTRTRGRRRGPRTGDVSVSGLAGIKDHRALMGTHQGCPQTPGGRIRALGCASTRTRGRCRGPRTGDVSVSGLAGIRPSGLDGDSKSISRFLLIHCFITEMFSVNGLGAVVSVPALHGGVTESATCGSCCRSRASLWAAKRV